MTLRKLKEAVRAHGLTCSVRDGEIRIAPRWKRERAEAVAYYTTDRADALGTARAMAAEIAAQEAAALAGLAAKQRGAR